MRLVKVEKMLTREEIGKLVVNYKNKGGKKVDLVTTLFKGGMSVAEIAKELKDSGFSYQVVYTYCKNYSLVNGLEVEGGRGKGNSESTELVLQLASQGLSVNEIAKKVKMTYQNVYSTLKRHGALNVRERIIQEKVDDLGQKKVSKKSTPEGIQKGQKVVAGK